MSHTPIDNGGPAFPVQITAAVAENLSPDDLADLLRNSGGMTLRDYFAANVIVTQAERTLFIQSGGFRAPTLFEDTLRCDAIIRYMKADALLAAQKGKS